MSEQKSWYSVINKKGKDITLYIHEVIGAFGVTSKDFIDTIKDSGAKNINLRINSPGGSVFHALGIYNFLKNSDFNVNTYIEGLAASSASIIALAGKVHMTDNSLFMIHNPLMGVMILTDADSEAIRNIAGDLEDKAKILDKVKEQIVNVYKSKLGDSVTDDKINNWLNAETWFDAGEAKAAGFIDEVTDEIKIAAEAQISELERQGYKFIPTNIKNKFENAPERQDDNSNNNDGGVVDKLIKGLKSLLVSNTNNTDTKNGDDKTFIDKVNSQLEEINNTINDMKGQLTTKDTTIENLNEQISGLKTDLAKAKGIETKTDPKQDPDPTTPTGNTIGKQFLGKITSSSRRQLSKNRTKELN